MLHVVEEEAARIPERVAARTVNSPTTSRSSGAPTVATWNGHVPVTGARAEMHWRTKRTNRWLKAQCSSLAREYATAARQGDVDILTGAGPATRWERGMRDFSVMFDSNPRRAELKPAGERSRQQLQGRATAAMERAALKMKLIIFKTTPLVILRICIGKKQ